MADNRSAVIVHTICGYAPRKPVQGRGFAYLILLNRNLRNVFQGSGFDRHLANAGNLAAVCVI